MSSYDFLAGCYDRLTYDVDYSAWADYIEKHFAKAPLPGRTVLGPSRRAGPLTAASDTRGTLPTGQHRERAYTVEELTTLLEGAGFVDVQTWGERKLRPPRPGEQRIFFTARKDT